MTTRVQFRNLNEQTFSKLRDLLPFEEGGSGQVDTNLHLGKLFEDEWNGDFQHEWMIDNVGSKWIKIEYYSTDFEPKLDVTIETAWSFPEQWCERVAEVLTQIDASVVLVGTYEDESKEPMGAFVFGYGYSDYEDLEVEIDFDRWDDDDEYRDEIYGELNSLMDDLCDGYLQSMEDNNSED